MKTKFLLAGGILAVFLMTLAFYPGCGSSGGSKNPASSSLDSLPNATLDTTTAGDAANQATSAASSASEVPKTSDYSNTGGINPFLLKALSRSKLPLEQKALISHALNSLNPQAVYTGCPTITDNSTYPTGTTIDITYDAGSGCTITTGTTLSGSFSIKGTISDSTGSVSLTAAFNNYKETIACTGGSTVMTASGGGTISASGLINASNSFSVSMNLQVNIGISSNCGQGSFSGSGFLIMLSTLSGTKSGSTWNVSGSETFGSKFAAGGAVFGDYSEWNGTMVIDTTANTATVNLTGRIGWEIGNQKGKIGIKLTNVVVDNSVCPGVEPKSGTLELTATNTAVLTFDGTASGCGCSPWSLNGIQQTVICW